MRFWNKYRKDLVITLPAKKHSAEVIKKLNDINELYDVMAMIKTYKYPKNVTKKNEEIVKSLVESDGTYKDRYIIYTIKTR